MNGSFQRWFFGVALAGASLLGSHTLARADAQFDISQRGAVGDGKTMNTKAIQATIDACAAAGGGTLVIPKGDFVTASLTLKPGVNVELQEGAVLEGSKTLDDYPIQKTRYEGHWPDRRIGLINADHCDHLHITGPGTLNGNGQEFWKINTNTGWPRMVIIQNSNDVTVSNVHFHNSGTWNLHLYNDKNVTVENCTMEISGGKGPTTDGTDIDSSQDVTIKGCTYSVNDDCICIKGSRYDAIPDTVSMPVKSIHITGCTFVRGMGACVLGTEAQKITDIEFDHSTVHGKMPMLRLKMRPDTIGQDYENINVHDIKLDSEQPKSLILSFELTHGTKTTVPTPKRTIKNITVTNITGTFGGVGKVAANALTDVSDIALKHFDVQVGDADLVSDGVTGLTMDDVKANGKPVEASRVRLDP